MRNSALLLILVGISLSACKTADGARNSAPAQFDDPGGRVVTFECWGSAMGVADAWAVYPDKVMIFTRNDFGRPERVIAETAINAAAISTIEQEIQELPPELIGKHFKKERVWDGVFFRISLDPAGQLTSERIEFENMYLPGVAPLVEAINAALPPDHQIQYNNRIGLRFRDLPTIDEDVYVP